MQIGDKVVIRKDSEYPTGPYRVGTVEAVTKTQVVVDGKRFMLRYPHAEYGHSDNHTYYDRLVPDMTIEQAKERNAEWLEQYQIEIMLSQLRNFRWSRINISDGDIVTIYKTMKQMGLFKE